MDLPIPTALYVSHILHPGRSWSHFIRVGKSSVICMSSSIHNYCVADSCGAGSFPRVVDTVTLSFSELADKHMDLSSKIEEGLGPAGLGIISISDVPEFSLLRKSLLGLAPKLAHLSNEAQMELEDPASRYTIGWSHGKEKLEHGKIDLMKGSFYANPVFDTPSTDAYLIQRYPSYCRPNIWPTTSLPELEAAFKALGKLMLDIGLMLAFHCDRYVVSKGAFAAGNKSLEELLKQSHCHKGRLLYYFPKQLCHYIQAADSLSSWCGWHTDHGSLTGLTCGLFTKDSVTVDFRDSNAGLYIKARNEEIVKAAFGEDTIAYQIGETTEILSRGVLIATPHCIRAPVGERAHGVERSSFALFMQPDWAEKLHFHGEGHQQEGQLKGGLTFGEYSELLAKKYYGHL